MTTKSLSQKHIEKSCVKCKNYEFATSDKTTSEHERVLNLHQKKFTIEEIAKKVYVGDFSECCDGSPSDYETRIEKYKQIVQRIIREGK